MITLKEMPGEFLKVNASLREVSLKLKWKWTGKGGRGEILIWFFLEPIVNLNHSKWSFVMQTNGQVRLKWKTEEYLKN